ncbi:MAG: serine/threonine-protein kinase [Planctomycetota bacterium]|jgi:hypothetical protein
MPNSKMVICPYCGETQPAEERCRACAGLFEPLSRQATHNAMGPWFVRTPERPFQPGCSYETIVRLIEREQITKYSIIRGPTTKQFWTVARRVAGIAHLLGYCHHCDAAVDSEDHGCHACGVSFGAFLDRNFLGLPEVRPLPWEAPVDDDLARDEQQPQAYEPRERPGGTGISSFASDEELLGGMRASHGPAGPQSTGAGLAAGTAEMVATAPASVARSPMTQPATAPAGTPEPSSGMAMRSMRRRLDAQSRTIRLLTILFVVTLIVTIVVTALSITRLAPPGEPVSAPPPAVDPDQELDSSSPPSSSDVAVETVAGDPLGAGPEPTLETSGDDMTDSSSTLPITPPPAEVDPTTLPPAEAQGLAIQLATAARDEQRPRAERLADYVEALRILRFIEANVPDADHPAGLSKTIELIEEQRERLELEEFYP